MEEGVLRTPTDSGLRIVAAKIRAQYPAHDQWAPQIRAAERQWKETGTEPRR